MNEKECCDIAAGLKTADPKIFGTNSFYFVCAPYFYNKMDELGLLEFNPYEGDYLFELKVYAKVKKYKNLEYDLSKKVQSNPGFAPYLGIGVYGANKNGYSKINAFFLQDFDTYGHEGIDFYGLRKLPSDPIKDHTPIHSLINGTIVKLGDHKEKYYGLHIIISDANNRLFCVGCDDGSDLELDFTGDIDGATGTFYNTNGTITLTVENDRYKATDDGSGDVVTVKK